jgi:hypothetical protein
VGECPPPKPPLKNRLFKKVDMVNPVALLVCGRGRLRYGQKHQYLTLLRHFVD